MHQIGEDHAAKLFKILKSAGRDLTGVTKVTWEMRAWDGDELNIDVRDDSDWAKGPERKTSGGR